MSDQLQHHDAHSAGSNPTDDQTVRMPLPATDASGKGAASSNAGGAHFSTANSDADADEATQQAMQSLLAHRKKRRVKRIIGAVVAALVVCVIAFMLYNTMNPPEDPGAYAPTTAVVTRGDFQDSVKASGSVQPVSSVVVTPEVDGIIVSVNVAQGDHVEKGQTLLTLKNDELDKAVREAGMQLRSAKNQLSSAQQAYQQAYDAYYADTEGMVDVETVNSAVDAVDSAQLALESAQSAYNDAVATANKRTVVAPASGSVVSMNAVEGSAVGAGAGATTGGSGSGGSLIVIGDLSQMKVTVQVNEVDISKIAVGQNATVTFSALPDVQLDAAVTNIATLSSAEGSGGYDSYGGSVVTYAVDLLIPQPDPNLKPGMTASVAIISTDIPNALMVPASAVTTGEGDQATVDVVTSWGEDGMPTTETRTVRILASGGADVVVEGDLQEGDEVLAEAGGDVPADDLAYGEDASASVEATSSVA